MSEKKPLLNRMLGDKLNGPPEWENAAEKVKFVTLRVGVADGTVWAVNRPELGSQCTASDRYGPRRRRDQQTRGG